ncbi:uncharacterized protein LOC126469855 [Schistocerca serialis cubense]|uniref:uncharacterized protein LOC126469855 n=1 Tax=Schistocerca serialis cubense TaxID=2023355 RepID=UPI00214E2E42|nr:uncharacterized protein LOC126469855 [Schistocerca serialis cubense]
MRALMVLAVALAAATTGLAWAAERCCGDAEPWQGQARAKRSFSAWGGKRAGPDGVAGADVDDGYGDGDDQKRAFSSWGGKRAVPGWQAARGSPLEDDKRSKQSFYSWGGKRGLDGEAEADGQAPEDAVEKKRGGVRFSSWGGKRDHFQDDDGGVEDLADSKRAFSSWGGKRFGDGAPAAEKRAFSTWGESLANRRLDLYNYRPVQLRNGNGPPFFPWGG